MELALSRVWARTNWSVPIGGHAIPSSCHGCRQLERSLHQSHRMPSIFHRRAPNHNPLSFWRRTLKCSVMEESNLLALVKTDGIGQDEEEEDDDSEDEDQPLWMEEDDPSWPDDDPDGEGVGFRVSNFFEPKIMNEDGSAVDEELSLDWEAEQYQWVVKEITSIEWDAIAHEDPTPLIFFGFERYGPNGAECWKLLEELEKVVQTIINSRKYPIRAVKLDVNSEPDVGKALEIKTVPALLFIKGCKLLHRQYGLKTEQELLAITSHLFYHSARPDCMDELDTSHKVTGISSSGRQH